MFVVFIKMNSSTGTAFVSDEKYYDNLLQLVYNSSEFT